MRISDVKIVSDGLVITFDDGSISYFPANTLYFNRTALGSQSFLDYDPSPTDSEGDGTADQDEMDRLDDDEAFTGEGALRAAAAASTYTLLR